MAFGVLVSRDPLRFENKYLWIRPDGAVAEEYWKRHPVPGEGSIPGTNRALVLPLDPSDPEKGTAGGGICYDADFPEVPLWLARSGAGLMLLPSSDWRGIDPLHSDMARIMGLSVGLSVFRSVRSATSMASDQFGRVLASRRFYIGGDGVMVADVPALPVPTLYAKIGESFPVACLAFGLLGLALIIGKSRRGRRAGSQP
jgi:apolipoprotein N-acyltransferase